MVTLDADGWISFSVHRPDAREVELVGAFSSWHEEAIPMSPAEDGWWRVRVAPGPGEYLFRYRIDGAAWSVDDHAHGARVDINGVQKSRVWYPPRDAAA